MPVQDELAFTSEDAWSGGAFEVLFYFDGASSAAPDLALKVLWNLPTLVGCWHDRDVEPTEPERVAPGSVECESAQKLYGIVTLPGRMRVACSSWHFRDENGSWLYFGIPMGSLGRAFPVGAYPFDDGTPTDWILPMSEWLQEIAASVFAEVRFAAGAIGWLSDNDLDCVLAATEGVIPSQRWIGILKREGESLKWYPPNELSPPIQTE